MLTNMKLLKLRLLLIALVASVVTLSAQDMREMIKEHPEYASSNLLGYIVIPALLYCIVEGRIDAASVKQATGALGDAATALGADPAVKTVIDAAGDALGAVCPEKAE